MIKLTFYGGRRQETTKFYFSFCPWTWFLGIQFREGSPSFKCVEIIAIKTERRQIYFLSSFSLLSRLRIIKSLVAVVCEHTKRTQEMLFDDWVQ